MKKIFKYTFIGLIGALSLNSCSGDLLDTTPTDSMSGSTLMSDGTNALIPLNGIYRSMYTPGWSTTGNTHQCFGISAYNLMAEVMGEDFVMASSGSGWFWFDAVYNVKSRYTSSAWRSYDLWLANYTWIANANYIIAAEETMEGATSDVNYAIGQAYAIRAYSYFMLEQQFARTIKGHESEAGVPIYTEPTMTSTTGQPRSTNAKVYEQIESDINKACEKLKGTTRQHKSHIDYATALGLKARILLTEEKWAAAAEAAVEAIKESGCKILPVSDFIGLNDVEKKNVMWGAEVISDQASGYASLYAHMDTAVTYGSGAPKRIAGSLYDHMSANDSRRAWFNPYSNYSDPETHSYQQVKFQFSNVSTWEGDYVWMRVEEMYLIAAEAYCHAGNDGEAKKYLEALMAQRDATWTDEGLSGNSYATLTSEHVRNSLMEEILWQRRIELWGEAGRIYDIRRLHQGFRRTAADGWPSSALLSTRPTDDPESYMWVLTIPQAEFDGNTNLDPTKDQNPTGDK